MKIIVTRQFEKDTEKELSKPMQLKLAAIIEELEKAAKIQSVNDVKKLKGYRTAYRIRMGDYRIGFVLEENTIKLSRIMNRREIYRYFP